jgi:hypothetical protein
MRPRSVIALLTTIAALCLAPISRASAGTPASFPVPSSSSGCQVQNAEPDPTCTPGAVFNVPIVQICQSGYATSVRDVTEATRAAVYAEYGLAPQPAGTYEVDHLVPLELGGSNDIANLWPEAASPFPGFHQKDALENYLHASICSGAIDLATAQTEIATDWLGAWYAAGQPGTGSSTTASVNSGAQNSGAQLPSGAGGDGHTFYASTASNASNIYCDTDSEWKRLSPNNLVSFNSLAAAMTALPDYHLHKPC